MKTKTKTRIAILLIFAVCISNCVETNYIGDRDSAIERERDYEVVGRIPQRFGHCREGCGPKPAPCDDGESCHAKVCCKEEPCNECYNDTCCNRPSFKPSCNSCNSCNTCNSCNKRPLGGLARFRNRNKPCHSCGECNSCNDCGCNTCSSCAPIGCDTCGPKCGSCCSGPIGCNSCDSCGPKPCDTCGPKPCSSCGPRPCSSCGPKPCECDTCDTCAPRSCGVGPCNEGCGRRRGCSDCPGKIICKRVCKDGKRDACGHNAVRKHRHLGLDACHERQGFYNDCKKINKKNCYKDVCKDQEEIFEDEVKCRNKVNCDDRCCKEKCFNRKASRCAYDIDDGHKGIRRRLNVGACSRGKTCEGRGISGEGYSEGRGCADNKFKVDGRVHAVEHDDREIRELDVDRDGDRVTYADKTNYQES